MHIKIKYEKGMFKPIGKIKGLKEGQTLDLAIDEMHAVAMTSGAFDFLHDEEDTYTEKDIIERA